MAFLTNEKSIWEDWAIWLHRFTGAFSASSRAHFSLVITVILFCETYLRYSFTLSLNQVAVYALLLWLNVWFFLIWKIFSLLFWQTNFFIFCLFIQYLIFVSHTYTFFSECKKQSTVKWWRLILLNYSYQKNYCQQIERHFSFTWYFFCWKIQIYLLFSKGDSEFVRSNDSLC